MAEVTQKNDLKSLSQSWSERIKDIRRIAQNNKWDEEGDDVTVSLPEEDAGVALPDEELFAGTVSEDLSVNQIFAGDEDFYKSLEIASPAVSQPSSCKAIPNESPYSSHVTKILVGGIVVIVLALVTHGILTTLPALRAFVPSQTAVLTKTEPVKAEPEGFLSAEESDALLGEEHPVSLQIAQDYYLEGDYSRACAVYEKLFRSLPKNADQDGLRDFLRLKIAICMEKTVGQEQAASLLETISKSPSLIVRILANYHLCQLQMQKNQYLTARSRAYQAIALLDAIGPEVPQTNELRRNCYFLAAEAISRQALFLSDADKKLPSELWPHFDAENTPLSNVDEQELHGILNTGSQPLSRALLGPQIEAVSGQGIRNWTVNCNRASIGEMMSRFSANAGYDVEWGMDANKTGVRDRSLSMYLTEVADRQCMTVATGCVGLLASLDEDNVVTIYNPAEYSSISEYLSLLYDEAISCWQRFSLVYHEDPYLGNAHFALGLLKAETGKTAESLAEYKMVSNRFLHSTLAPAALMNSAKLKNSLHDYPGAYSDLKEAVEQYPDYPEIDRTYLSLGEVTLRMGHRSEATKLYSKVYYLNSSRQTQSTAALAAGQTFYQDQDFTNAEKWLTRYLTLEKDNKDPQFYRVCLLLGKTWQALGNSELACDALRSSLSGQLPQKDFVEAASALVEVYIEKGDFVRAQGVLNETSSRQLSQEESVRMLVLKSRALCGIGLVDKAIVLLSEREEYLIDDILKARIGYELGECYIERGEFDLAYKKLTKALEWADSESMMQKTSLRLAEVCCQLGLDTQAMNVCSQLLHSQPSPAIEHKTLTLLAQIYNKQKNYDRAALSLLGQWL